MPPEGRRALVLVPHSAETRASAMSVESTAELKTSSATEEYRRDVRKFKSLKVMRPGFEESAEGNTTLDEAKAKAAPIIAKGADVSEEEKNTLCDIMDQLYYKEPLIKLLQYHHPSTNTSSLSKKQIIDKLIQAKAGLPSIGVWFEVYARISESQMRNLEDTKMEEEEDDERDESKASRHSRKHRRSPTRHDANKRQRRRSPERRHEYHRRDYGRNFYDRFQDRTHARERRGFNERRERQLSFSRERSRALDRPSSSLQEDSKVQVTDQLKKFLEEVDTKLEAKMETFKTMCMDASRNGYLKGRREANSGGPDDSWLTVPQQVLQLAMELKYIDLKMVDFNPPKSKKRKTVIPLGGAVEVRVNDDGKDDEAVLSWIKVQYGLTTIIKIYTVDAKHIDKLPEMFNYQMQLQRLGETYTWESLARTDVQVRSSEQGQGPSMVWRIDFSLRMVFLKEYQPKDKKNHGGRGKVVHLKPSNGLCYRWAANEPCIYENCKYNHRCSVCNVAKPKIHDLNKCKSRESIKAGLKKLKAT